MKFSRTATLAALMLLCMGSILPAAAQTVATAEPAAMVVDADMTEGVIRKVSKDTGKLTIKHGEIKNLDMPPMTMVFTAKDPAMLDEVAVGNKVRFVVIEASGKMVVTQLQLVK